jgi:two-component system, cell cycle response regulator CpdR
VAPLCLLPFLPVKQADDRPARVRRECTKKEEEQFDLVGVFGTCRRIVRAHRVEPVTILLAEDEGLLLLDFEQALTEAGFSVVAVSSGSKAVEFLNGAKTSIQGVVTDVRFPEPPDGWEVARVAREIDPGIPIVYVSGDSAPDWPSKGVPNSIMLGKPFAIAQLVTAISQLLNDRLTGTTLS